MQVCVDQAGPGPEIATLPGFVACAHTMLVYHTDDYEERAWSVPWVPGGADDVLRPLHRGGPALRSQGGVSAPAPAHSQGGLLGESRTRISP
eukprot:5851443-Pyramimonas_sp.AAC.1